MLPRVFTIPSVDVYNACRYDDGYDLIQYGMIHVNVYLFFSFISICVRFVG